MVSERDFGGADILREADAIFLEELHNADWYHKTSQAFAVFLPVKSVGVVGDARRYEYVIALRAVETVDFMTARWAHLPYELLEKASNRIINEIAHVVDKSTVATFVEDEETLKCLQEIGVDYVQGDWLGAPQPLTLIH